VIPVQPAEIVSNQSEQELYPLLANYLFSVWGIHPKRIDENVLPTVEGQTVTNGSFLIW